MAILIDEQRTELAGSTLAEVLDSAQNELQPRGRVVVEVALDGRSLSGPDLETEQDAAVADRDVRLTTADPRQLVAQTLRQVDDRLEEARELQNEAAELLQQDKPSSAMDRVGEAINIWLQAQQAVLNSAMLLGIDLDQLTIDGEPLKSFTDELLEQLQNVKELLGSQDTVALADALAYEWPELVDRWHRLLATLVAHVEGG
ncbi:MAG: hypothetical protein ACOCTI_03430 [Phycisphaeraceae bacterium]